MVVDVTSAGFFGIDSGWIFVMVVWSLIWKGLALWKSARLKNTVWFVLFMILQTVGILEILYLFVFSKPKSPVMATTKKVSVNRVSKAKKRR